MLFVPLPAPALLFVPVTAPTELFVPDTAPFELYSGLSEISTDGSGNSKPDTEIMMCSFLTATFLVAPDDPPEPVLMETTRAEAASCGLSRPQSAFASANGIDASLWQIHL